MWQGLYSFYESWTWSCIISKWMPRHFQEQQHKISDYFTVHEAYLEKQGCSQNLILCPVNACDLLVPYEPPQDKTNKVAVCPAKAQISLGICPVWSESSLCTRWVAKDPRYLHGDSKDSDQTGRMTRVICLQWTHMPFCWFCHEAVHIPLKLWVHYFLRSICLNTSDFY